MPPGEGERQRGVGEREIEIERERERGTGKKSETEGGTRLLTRCSKYTTDSQFGDVCSQRSEVRGLKGGGAERVRGGREA